MQFDKPSAGSLQSERDVEDKLLYPILVGNTPSGLGIEESQVRGQKNLRSFVIGKGSDQKSYIPDYLVVQGSLPLMVAEGKKPGADIISAFREARLYASELNAMHPSGLNPVTRVLATNGDRVVAGWHDQANPVVDLSFDEIDPYSPKMSELIRLFGNETLSRYYQSLLPHVKAVHYWKPVKLVGGLSKQKEQLPINSFATTITADFGHLFNPQTRDDRRYIARHAYISSKRRERYIEPIDRVIRAATPASVTDSKTLEDTERPSEIIKPFRAARSLEQKIMLLIGSAGAGKSTFVDYLQEQALPADIRAKTLWVRIDMNPAPISRDEIYPWLREEIIKGCISANPKTDFSDLTTIKAVHSVEVNEFRKGEGRLYQSTPGQYDTKLADLLVNLKRDRHKVAINTARYCTSEKGILLVIVLDNCDKRLREEQLLMFEAAQWLQKEFRGLIMLPLREETYDNHRDEPPLDTALKDLVFRIEPPLFQRILASRVNLALRELSTKSHKLLRYNLPNGIQVEYPASDQGFYFSSILLSIFEHDRYVRRLIVGLSGRNMRRALEIFLDFCKSGHIGSDEITKIRLSQGRHVLPLGLVTNVLLRASQRFYDSDASYIKNLFAADIRDPRPNFFARLIILETLKNRYDAPGHDRLKAYIRVAELREIVQKFGVEPDLFFREVEYLAKSFCLVCEDFRRTNITDLELVSIAPAGHVHLEICMDQYYLAAIAEDSWYRTESRAQGIAQRITDTRTHYTNATVLDNAEEALEELEFHQAREIAAYRAIFSNDDLGGLIDLSKARSRLARFEGEVASGSWIGANKRFPIGLVLQSKISGLAPFGVFVELERDLNGLVHSSKLPSNFADDVRLKRGETIEVKVLNVNRVERRVELEWVR